MSFERLAAVVIVVATAVSVTCAIKIRLLLNEALANVCKEAP